MNQTEQKMNNVVTMQSILDKIRGTTYTLLPDGRTTVCQLTMANGFSVNGYSSVVDASKYNQYLGEKIARDDALSNVWPFEGYLLAERLAQAKGQMELGLA